MKNYTIVLAFLFKAVIVMGQSNYPAISKDMPNLLSPSPSVAALMKFEEVPVNNYTGIPDVSIPLFSSPTLSKDISLNVALKYHSGSTGVDEKASDVGLGWSLFAGGSISRTVRGLPDEIYDTNDYHKGGAKIGVYHDTGTVKNSLTQILAFQEFGPSNNQEYETLNEFLWNTTERGMYDTEYDLWQFNFMGKSGRFTIRKNPTTHLLEIKDLNLDSNLKIVNYYNATTYEPTYFVIYDDLGNRYTFDVKEKTKTDSTSFIRHQSPSIDPVTTPPGDPLEFSSAFHLSKIEDNNNNSILTINYNNAAGVYNELVLDHSTTYNLDAIGNGALAATIYLLEYYISYDLSQIANIDPAVTQTTTQRKITTRKISSISVEGQCVIGFDYTLGRQDSNYSGASISPVFKGITVKDWQENEVKNVILHQGYSETIEKRMVLDSVQFGNPNTSKKETYKFEYKEKPFAYDGNIKKDKWGYFNLHPTWLNDKFFYREVTPSMSTIETIQKMTLPTGGCIMFDFEANRYSYSGADELPNFDANPYNWDNHTEDFNFFQNTSSNALTIYTSVNSFTITEEQEVTFDVNFGGFPSDNYCAFSVYKQGSPALAGGIDNGMCEAGPCRFRRLLQPGTYIVKFTSPDAPSGFNVSMVAHYKTRNSNNFKFVFGGGNRIKRIGYFDDGTVPKDFYEASYPSFKPAKQKEFVYNKFENPLYSSGSIATGEPVFEYDFKRTYYFYLDCTGGVCGGMSPELSFHKIMDTNNLKAIRTGGSDVGYQNVTVKETNNGRTEYTYNSPIDFPEELPLESTVFPFKATSNLDYKRGLLNKEEVFNNDGKPLSITHSNYEYEEVPIEETTYGVISNYQQMNRPWMWLIPGYGPYQALNNFFDTCAATGGMYLKIHCESRIDPRFYISYYPLRAANGWAKLSSKTTKNYFYPEGLPSESLSTAETYEYNPLNKKISVSTVKDSEEKILKTEYYYHTGNTNGHLNRISEIERIDSYKDNVLLSSSKILYSKVLPGNNSYLPASIQIAKGSGTFEPRIKYNRYDDFGRPLELQKENGTLVSYVWGSDNIQPMAKIENAGYELLATTLGVDVNDVNESGLTEVNGLRTTLPEAMITTYTYKPLVGINTMTDPKGDTTTYHYDDFGRLIKVADNLGNIVSENQYHYRTQN